MSKTESLNIESINREFEVMIYQKKIYKKLGLTMHTIGDIRYRMRNGIHLTIQRKQELLLKAGWRWEGVQYTDADMLSFLNYYLRAKCSDAAKEMGPEYALEKWKMIQGKK